MRPPRSVVGLNALVHSLRLPTRAPRASLPSQCRAQPARTFLGRSSSSHRAVENLNVDRMRHNAYDYHVRRRNFLMAGAVSGVVAFIYTAYLLKKALANPKKLDAGLPAGADPFSTEAGIKRKTVIHDADGRELVPTGNSTVPMFPRTLDLNIGATDSQESTAGVEYTLVGLGVRTVSFLGIQVYMVGYYVATSDIAAIQAKLVKQIDPIATTLVPGERDELKRRLLDPVEGERLWREVLRDCAPRSVFRIVPVRDTDFHHLRDGFVRAITAQSQKEPDAYKDEAFGLAMKDFRALFNRGKVPKRGEMLLVRDARGRLTITYDDGKPPGDGKDQGTIGRISDERVSRALWMNYLAGKSVASEAARQNIVDGIMEFVERPIGTVAAQVV